MAKPSYDQLSRQYDRARQRRDCALRLLAAGSDPRSSLKGIAAQAARDMKRIQAQARPFIKDQREAGYQR